MECVITVSLLFGILKCSEEPSVPGRLAQEYSEIVVTLKDALTRVGQSREGRAEASAGARIQFQRLLGYARVAGWEMLNGADLVALSECAARLDEHAKSLLFAQEAVRRTDDFKARVALVRAFCLAGRLADAEGVVRDSSETYSNETRLYLLNALLALKYREMSRVQPAYLHTRRVAEVVVNQVEQGQFYASYLGRVIADLLRLAQMADREKEATETVLEWHSILKRRFDWRVASMTARIDGRARTAGELAAIRLLSQGMLRLDDQCDGSDSERTIREWFAVVLCFERKRLIWEEWLAEVGIVLRECEMGLSPNWSGACLEYQVNEAIALIESIHDEGEQALAGQTLKDAKTVLATLRQFRCNRSAAGRNLLNKQAWRRINPEGRAFVLLRVSNQSLTSPRQSIETIKAHVDAFARLRDVNVQLQCIAVPDHVEDVNRQHTSESRANPLRATILPITVLLDESGRFIAALTGGEPEKIDRLLKRAAARATLLNDD